MTENQNRVLAVIKNGTGDMQEIVKETNIPFSEVSDALYALMFDGFILCNEDKEPYLWACALDATLQRASVETGLTKSTVEEISEAEIRVDSDGHFASREQVALAEIGRFFRRLRALPGSRLLKDDEMPIKISDWERIQAAIAMLKKQRDPVAIAQRIQQISDECKAERNPQKEPPFERVSNGWIDSRTTQHGTAQDSDLLAKAEGDQP